MIGVTCPRCSGCFDVEDNLNGQQDRCPHCAIPIHLSPHPSNIHECVLYRHQDTTATLSTDAVISQYLDDLSAIVLESIIFPPDGPGAEFTIPVSVKASGHASFAAITTPPDLMPDTAFLARLLAALFAVPLPAINTEVREYLLKFAVRGGISKESATS